MSNMSASPPLLLEKLIENASVVPIPANTRHLLIETNMVWVVGAIPGDIYAWEYENPNFIPFFIQEMAPGDLIFGSSPEMLTHSETFVFISARPSILYKIPFATFREFLSDDQDIILAIADKLEKWAGKILNLFTASSEPHDSVEFPISGIHDLEPGEKARLQLTIGPERKHRLGWIECISGTVEIEGNPSLRLSESPVLYPFSFFLWIEAAEEARIRSYTTLEALDKPELWDGLCHFHHQLFAFFKMQQEQDFRHAQERRAKNKNLEATSDKESMLTLGSLLEKQLAYAPLQEGDSLFKACDLIGQVLQVKMKPSSGTLPTIDQQVHEIAILSGLFPRKITLKGKWWETADLPLLGFYGKEEKPVALINVSRTEFEFLDPETLQREKVTPVNATHFHPSAFVFHLPFTGEKITFFKLLKFAYREAFKESYIFPILAILTGIINLYLPFAMKALFDSLTVTANITLLMQLSVGLVMSAIGLGFFTITKNFAMQRVNGLSKNKLELGLWGRLLNFPVSFFRKRSAGELMGEFRAITAAYTLLNDHLIVSLFAAIYTLLYFIQMFTFSTGLALVGLLGTLLPLGIFAICAALQISLFKKITDLSGTIQGFVIQLISGLGKIRVAGAESRFFKIWSRLFAEKKRLSLRFQKLQTVTSLTRTLFPLIATVAIYTVAIVFFQKQKLGAAQKLTTGEFVGFAAAYALFISSTLDLLNNGFAGLQIKSLWECAKTLREQPVEASLDKERAHPLKGKVVIDHVSYRYNPEVELTLKDIVIEALPGEMIGIIGPSGAGKSTLVRLLLGFERPESGAIYFDDKSLDDFDPRSIRSQIGTVLQNAALIAGSIYDNIVGSASYPDEALERAIHFSGFEDDLKLLPMGLNTIIPMGGGSFSGGQRQRLLLARALISSPKILLLDEATSALDNKTQDIVTNHLNRLRVTRIVIAHRLSTIQNADRIYVLEQGQVVQVGTFQELAQQDGLFLHMLKRQTL